MLLSFENYQRNNSVRLRNLSVFGPETAGHSGGFWIVLVDTNESNLSPLTLATCVLPTNDTAEANPEHGEPKNVTELSDTPS